MDATNLKQTICLRQYDPFTPPDWRALDATRLAAGEKTKWAEEDDAAVQEYADFLRRAAVGQSDRQLVDEAEQSAMAIAHELYREHGLRRAEIEARLVAGQSDEEIAETCGVPPDVVAAYERLFCCIRYCRTATDYLLIHLVGPGVQIGFQDHEVGRFWTWMAMGDGPLVLDTFIRAFHAASRPDQAEGLGLYLQPDAGVSRGIQAIVASAVLPMTGPAAEAFRENHLLLMEAEAADDPDRAAFLREKARDWIIRSARAYLAGKSIPRRRRSKTFGRRRGTRDVPAGGKKRMTFAMWDDLVTATISRAGKRKSR